MSVSDTTKQSKIGAVLVVPEMSGGGLARATVMSCAGW
jgi:hypothetical protein